MLPTMFILTIAALLLPTALSFGAEPFSSSSDSGLVSVSVQRCLPVSPKRARDAWVAYTFQQGGGQPSLVLSQDPNTRLLVPLFAKETVVEENEKTVATDQCRVEYTVSSLGPIWKLDIKEGSHVGIVTFDTTSRDECSMTWTSSYTALHRRGFWETVTRFLISNASENLASYLATPQLYTRQTNIISNNKITPKMALEAWVDFVFLQGGGLPLNPPFVLNSGSNEGENAELLRIPPLFLREEITSIHCVDDEKECWLEYKVVNPGLFTFPVYSHVGRVRFFAQDESAVKMDWQVEIRPMRGLEAISKAFTEMVVTTLARNLMSHLQEPNGSVPVYPPRGGSGGEPILRVSKDSWLGGVLAAHLSDGRSTWEQTIAMFQPWTWGRSTDEEGECAEWTEGFIE